MIAPPVLPGPSPRCLQGEAWGHRWNDVSEDEPLEVADDEGAEDRAVDGALIAADDKEIVMCLLTIPGLNDEV